MNIERKMIPDTMYAKGQKLISLKWIVIHETGNPRKGANADMHAKYLLTSASQKAQTCWHYTIDDKKVIQHLEDDQVGWHAGDWEANNNSIGFETCVNSDGDLFLATENTARLTAELLIKHGLNLENVKQHNFFMDKNCPAMLRSNKPYSWDRFLERVGDYCNSKLKLEEKKTERRGL